LMQTDEDMAEHARRYAKGNYHPVGTCHIGADDDAVVDSSLRVRGVFESDVPIVVQHTRMDSGHCEVSLLSTIAYADA